MFFVMIRLTPISTRTYTLLPYTTLFRSYASRPNLGVRPHKMTFRFRCNSCGETHEGIPTFGADMPSIAQWISAADRPSRVDLGTDDCVVDGERFLVRGCLEIPVQGEADPFVWGVWVALIQANFASWVGRSI